MAVGRFVGLVTPGRRHLASLQTVLNSDIGSVVRITAVLQHNLNKRLVMALEQTKEILAGLQTI